MAKNRTKEALIERFKDHSAVIAVMGMGYVGLPLAVVFADQGFRVIGIDPIPQKVAAICRGESYLDDVPSALVDRLVKSGKLSATSDFSAIRSADAVSICVPTPLNKTGDPDVSYIAAATQQLVKYLHKGMTIVLESSTYPGTTRELILPRLLEVEGLKLGEDFFLAFSPERVDPGRKDWTTKNTPKVIGGITPDCLEVSCAWYGQALEKIVPVSSAEVAEMTKLLENTYRMINIGLVNEMAIMCDYMGVDVWEVVEAAGTKPFGFTKFTPGPGIGGHCIPIDPLYLSWKMRTFNYQARFIELASSINSTMPRYVTNKIQNALNMREKHLKNSNILILGVAYKENIDDMRESPALDIMHLLKGRGANVFYHDPHVPSCVCDGDRVDRVKDLNAALRISDCVVIVTAHSAYNFPEILANSDLIMDTRNALGDLGKNNPKVVRL
jgi:UDP-N-acetyl-D-glucosamine dehydrogenase